MPRGNIGSGGQARWSERGNELFPGTGRMTNSGKGEVGIICLLIFINLLPTHVLVLKVEDSRLFCEYDSPELRKRRLKIMIIRPCATALGQSNCDLQSI